MTTCAGRPWHDASENGHDGVLRNFNESPSGGWIGTGSPADPFALQFDGVDDFVELLPGADRVQPTREFSVELWLYLDRATTEGIYSNRDGAGDPTGLCIGKDVSYPEWGATVTTDGMTRLWLKSDAPSATGRWTHEVITFSVSAGAARIYIDGVRQRAEVAIKGPMTYSMAALPRLGEKNGIYPFNGRIAMVRVWGRALSEAEVTARRAHDAPRFGISVAPPTMEVTGMLLVDLEAVGCVP